MKDWFKLIIGRLIVVLGFIGIILSAYVIQFAGLSFFVTLIAYFLIGGFSAWWMIFTPIIILIGGIIGLFLNAFATTLGSKLLDEN
jgi:uncharacterized membrane protein YbaN (DUF454 family)